MRNLKSFIITSTLLMAVSSLLFSQQKQISFSTNEGTWVSLDVAPNGKSLVFELLGDIYSLPIEGGRARPILSGSAFQSQPRFSPNGKLIVYISDESGFDYSPLFDPEAFYLVSFKSIS